MLRALRPRGGKFFTGVVLMHSKRGKFLSIVMALALVACFGAALARLTAEKKNPQVDILLGGPADVYTAGCDAGVFAEYAPKEQALTPAEYRDPGNRWTGIGLIPLCFLTNTDFLKEHNMKAPESWQDLLDPAYKNGLQMADARTSGTATERIYSLIAVYGVDGAFDYQPALHEERRGRRAADSAGAGGERNILPRRRARHSAAGLPGRHHLSEGGRDLRHRGDGHRRRREEPRRG